MLFATEKIERNIQGGRLTGKPGNDREFFKIFNKKRFQFVLNVLHKVIYLYIKLCISKFPPYFVISVYQEKLHCRILDKKYFKTLKTHCINCYSLETVFFNDRELFSSMKTATLNIFLKFKMCPFRW